MKKIILIGALSILASTAFAQQSNTTSNTTLNNAMNQAKNSGGDFNARVPNPFVFCSAPKPSKHNPMRIVWEQVCPSGNAQAAAAPVPVPIANPPSTTNATRALQEQFNKENNTNSTISGNSNNNTSNLNNKTNSNIRSDMINNVN